ncbi:MAG: adenine nucleotide alpha hydrolase [Acidobacteriaceae bacterium]|jgi:uncharacterized protein (TIGR00290 family)|nr:adenine nucleotide alpha hydrolase [Acidobacteriaceae bacterium]
MRTRPRAAISWSGGKDSSAALMRVHADYDVVAMITMFDEDERRSRSHGLRPTVVNAQAERLGLRRYTGQSSWTRYDEEFGRVLMNVAADGITHVVFGDILFDEQRQWAERQCAAHGLIAVEPLFGHSTLALFHDWIASGADATIVTVRDSSLDRSYLGRTLTADLLPAFLARGVDPCGEHGEYHTVVTDMPLFDRPLRLAAGEAVFVSGCWALDYEVAVAARV